jgi:hypothetical protein
MYTIAIVQDLSTTVPGETTKILCLSGYSSQAS